MSYGSTPNSMSDWSPPESGEFGTPRGLVKCDACVVTPEELRSLSQRVEAFPDLLDARPWFEQQLSQIGSAIKADTSGGRRDRTRFHPLAELLYQVRAELADANAKTFQRTWSLCRLLSIAGNIEQLSVAQVEGLQDRLSHLIGPDWNQFESTRFELDVAALQLATRRSVRFLTEQRGVRTPDLEVAGFIEIECKRKVELSKADLAMHEQWSLLGRNIFKILVGAGAFRVEVDTVEAPMRSDVDWVTRELREMAKSAHGDGLVLEALDGDRRLRLLTLNMIEENGVRIDEPSGLRPLESFDVGSMEITARVQGARMIPWSAIQLCFATEKKKDWLEGVKRSLGDARGQLTGTRPGVVFVEVPAVAMARSGQGLGALKPVVMETFRNSRRISAVLIAFTGWNDEQRTVVTEYHLERNPAAVHPLPGHFYVADAIRKEWKAATGRNAPCPCGSGSKFKQCCHP